MQMNDITENHLAETSGSDTHSVWLRVCRCGKLICIQNSLNLKKSLSWTLV